MDRSSPEKLKMVFVDLKPICDNMMSNPSKDNMKRFVEGVNRAPKSTIQEMQLYLVFPLLANLKSERFSKKYEYQRMFVDGIHDILTLVEIDSLDLFDKYHTCLTHLILDKKQPTMVANIPEELKLSVVKALSMLMTKLTDYTRIKLYSSNKRTVLGQSIYVVVKIAITEKLRPLKMAALNCISALTATHDDLVDTNYMLKNRKLAALVAETLSAILPGVLAGLQDVALSRENQGSLITAKAVNMIHRVVCVVMSEGQVETPFNVRTEDFVKLIHPFTPIPSQNSSNEIPNPKAEYKSPEWYKYVGPKVKIMMRSLMTLKNHGDVKVRKELAAFCNKILLQCAITMAPSITDVLDALIILSEDEYPDVANYCQTTLQAYFLDSSQLSRCKTLDNLTDKFYRMLDALPRTMNGIYSQKKLSGLKLFGGYLKLLANDEKPQRLTLALGCRGGLDALCNCLVECVRMGSSLSCLCLLNSHDIEAPIQTATPWCKMIHLDDRPTQERMKKICRHLGTTDAADSIVDRLLEMFDEGSDRAEIVYLVNYIASEELVQADRVLNTYLDYGAWYLPLEVGTHEPELTCEDTLDLTIYDPRAWDKDSVPGLYEGTVETRYTDIPLQTSRVAKPPADPNRCRTLLEAQENMVLSCLLTEGVGLLAKKMRDKFQPYLLKTLCLMLERVGSKYEMLHLAGMKALWDITFALGHQNVTQLIKANADYFTYQVTTRLKKAWNSVSALHILTVVMRYSDSSILSCLDGIITDVLMQSCDNYHVQDVTAYLQVFLTFVTCVRKWFPNVQHKKRDEAYHEGHGPPEKSVVDVWQYDDPLEKHDYTTENICDTPKKIKDKHKKDDSSVKCKFSIAKIYDPHGKCEDFLEIIDTPKKPEVVLEEIVDTYEKTEVKLHEIDDSPEKSEHSIDKKYDTHEKCEDFPKTVDTPEKPEVVLEEIVDTYEKTELTSHEIGDSPKKREHSIDKKYDLHEKCEDFSETIDTPEKPEVLLEEIVDTYERTDVTLHETDDSPEKSQHLIEKKYDPHEKCEDSPETIDTPEKPEVLLEEIVDTYEKTEVTLHEIDDPSKKSEHSIEKKYEPHEKCEDFPETIDTPEKPEVILEEIVDTYEKTEVTLHKIDDSPKKSEHSIEKKYDQHGKHRDSFEKDKDMYAKTFDAISETLELSDDMPQKYSSEDNESSDEKISDVENKLSRVNIDECENSSDSLLFAFDDIGPSERSKKLPHKYSSENTICDEEINDCCKILSDSLQYMENIDVPEQLLSQQEFEDDTGKTTEEMFQEDLTSKQDSDDGMDYNNYEEKKPPPVHVTMTVKILKRCIHFVPSRNREEKLLALQTLNNGLRILEQYEDELLPVVHQIWSPLVVRFMEVEIPVVVRRAFDLLVTMADLSKDFIRNRTVNEVLPSLCIFLKRSSQDSILKDAGSMYRISQAYQLQLSLLNKLGPLSKDLGLTDSNLEKILASASPYLSNKQPKPLQAAAVSLFRIALTYDFGTTWQFLRDLCNNQDVVQSQSLEIVDRLSLRPILGSPRNPHSREYKDNVVAIFYVLRFK